MSTSTTPGMVILLSVVQLSSARQLVRLRFSEQIALDKRVTDGSGRDKMELIQFRVRLK